MHSRNNPPSTGDNKVVPKKINTDDPNWQSTMTTVCERNAVLFNNDLMSDIKFLVGSDDNIQTVPAHKLILATGSSVFYAMFYGSLAEKKSEIRVPDVEPAAFLILLKYLYFDKIHLEADNVLDTLYVAKKYIVPHLTTACANYIGTNLTVENACHLLSQSRLYDELDLMERCLKVIDAQTELVIKTKAFLDVDLKTLESILSRDTLKCREINLFEATVKWADDACKEMDIEPTPQNRRDVLGETLTMIRFPIMTLKEFSNRVAHLEILTSDESSDIFRYLTADTKPNIFNFSTKKRTEMIRVDYSLRTAEWSKALMVHSYSIQIAVEKKIFIIGFEMDELSLFYHKQANISVKIKLWEEGSLNAVAENNASFLKDVSSKSWQVLFKDPVPIKANTIYAFSAVFSEVIPVVCYKYNNWCMSDSNVYLNNSMIVNNSMIDDQLSNHCVFHKIIIYE